MIITIFLMSDVNTENMADILMGVIMAGLISYHISMMILLNIESNMILMYIS